MADPYGPPPTPGQVTRIARRRALPGHEAEYETLVREMFGHLRGPSCSSPCSTPG